MSTDLARQLVGIPHTLVDVREAREAYAAFRGLMDAKAVATPLLTAPGDNSKFKKTDYVTYGLSLAQADSSDVFNTCRWSTAECRKGCVSYAGKGELATVQAGRTRKTLFLGMNPNAFLTLLVDELTKVWNKHGTTARVRLNTFSDLPWEDIEIGTTSIFGIFTRMRFYDYTKGGDRAMAANLGAFEWPGNYRLTYSASEKTKDEQVVEDVKAGINTALLFDVPRGRPLPSIWKGVHIIDGDATDNRWDDPSYRLIGLRAKGRMRKANNSPTGEGWKMVRKGDT